MKLLLIALLLPLPAMAQEYSSGHTALQVWNAEAQANLPLWIKVWLVFMGSVFIGGLLFVKNHSEARWLVGGFVGGLLFSKLAIPALGLVPLSGLVALIHLVFWAPALWLMLKNRPFLNTLSPYSVWAGLATACILFSFIFDVRDAVIYVAHLFTA